MNSNTQPPRITRAQLRTLYALIAWLGLSNTVLKKLLHEFTVATLGELPRESAGEFATAVLKIAREPKK